MSKSSGLRQNIKLFSTALVLSFTLSMNAQEIGINSFGTLPNNSSALDVDFENKGFLPPRVADTNSIQSPAEGLQIYDISSKCMRYRNNIKWSECMDFGGVPSGNIGSINCSGISVSGSICSFNPVTGTTFSVPYVGATFGTYDSQSISSIGVFGLTATLNSGTYNALGNGELVFNVSGTATSEGIAIFPFSINGQNCSVSIGVGENFPLNSVNAQSASNIGTTSFIANWDALPNATGYFLDIAYDNSFSSFVNGFSNFFVGNNLNYFITGLLSGTNYYYRVRGINACNVSINSNTVSLSTATNNIIGCDPSQPLSSYQIITNVLGQPNLMWITRNLGSYLEATSAGDNSANSAGCYYAFNYSQAHGVNGTNGSGTNPTWNIPAVASGSWSISNDPCYINFGSGWRIPTNTEWSNVDVAYGWSSHIQAYASPLKIHAAGYINFGSMTLTSRGIDGNFWSSTEYNSSWAWFLATSGSISGMYFNNKMYGLSVRCVK